MLTFPSRLCAILRPGDDPAPLLGAGVKLFLLEWGGHPPGAALARERTQTLAARGAWLLLAGDPALAAQAGARGVVLESPALPDGVRGDFPGLLLGVTARTEAEARTARDSGADFLWASPVFPAPERFAEPYFGVSGINRISIDSPLPILARGAITRDAAAVVLAAGASAIAVGDAIRRAPNRVNAAKAFLTQSGEGPTLKVLQG